MSWRSTTLCLLVACAVSAPAWADDGALRAFLGSPDQLGSAALMRQLDATGEGLRAIAADRRETRYVRMRAASWLAAYDAPAERSATRASLAALARAEGDDVEVRAQAINALGLFDGAAATGHLVSALASRERVVREAAVIALVRVKTPEARAALVAHRARETDALIRGRIVGP